MATDHQGGGNGNGNGTVSYSIKELLDGIKTSIDRLYGKLDTKADRSEVAELSRQMDHESRRIDTLENTRDADARSDNRMQEWQRWAIPVLITIAMLAVSIIQLMKGGK